MAYVIHHSCQVELYAVTREQLEILMQNKSNKWKLHIALSIFITSIINMMAIGFDMSNASFRINIGIGVLSLIGFTIALKFYLSEKHRNNKRLQKTLNQPVQRFQTDKQAL